MALKYGLALLALASFAAPQQQYPGWHTQPSQAWAEAKRTGKPLFIVFR